MWFSTYVYRRLLRSQDYFLSVNGPMLGEGMMHVGTC